MQIVLLSRHTGTRTGRVHDGKVVVMRSNLRWCSDGFEITCWNGEVVRAAFIIDAHDREIIAWHATVGAGISGGIVRNPQSNGMAESLVKTFKRDYLRVNPLPDAVTALRQFAGWFEDYNENHPHSGLKMHSPRGFIRATAQ